MKQTITLGLAVLLVAAIVLIGLRDDDGEPTSASPDDQATATAAVNPSSTATPAAAAPSPEAVATEVPAPPTLNTRTAPDRADITCPDQARDSTIVFVYSVEKETLMDRAVADFNALGCGRVEGYELASGIQMSRLARGWPLEDSDIPPPHLASPSTSLWAIEANAQALEADVDVVISLDDVTGFGWAPLVAAMPESVQRELAPDGVIGLADLAARAGTTVAGHPFVLRKSNPDVASTGLMAVIAAYATGGSVETLTADSLAADSETLALARGLEAATPVYGRTSLSVLEEMCALDNQGISPAAAVSVLLTEEQLVVDYNRGTGDFGCENSGTPNERLVAVYLDSPTPVSEHPLLPIDASWVNDGEQLLVEAFVAFATDPASLAEIQPELGVRDAAGRFPVDDPASVGIAAELDPTVFAQRPQPSAEALAAMRQDWHRARKPFEIHFLVDVSGSMNFEAGVEGTETTRLDEVKEALGDFVNQLQGPNDAISISTFPAPQPQFATQQVLDLTVAGPGTTPEILAVVNQLRANGDTPLYNAIDDTYRQLVAESAESDAITVMVVLTDGLNDDRGLDRSDWTTAEIEADAARGRDVANELGRLATAAPVEQRVRIFTISYGPEAEAGDEILATFAGRTFGQPTRSTTSEIVVILRSIISRL